MCDHPVGYEWLTRGHLHKADWPSFLLQLPSSDVIPQSGASPLPPSCLGWPRAGLVQGTSAAASSWVHTHATPEVGISPLPPPPPANSYILSAGPCTARYLELLSSALWPLTNLHFSRHPLQKQTANKQTKATSKQTRPPPTKAESNENLRAQTYMFRMHFGGMIVQWNNDSISHLHTVAGPALLTRGLQYQAWNPSCRAYFISSQKALGYPPTIMLLLHK